MGEGIVKSFSITQLPAPLQEFYAFIQSDLLEVEQQLRRFLTSDNPFIQQVVDHGFQLGGKRMRPALHLFFALMAGEIRPIHHVIGAVLETIHTASLIHDDILDEAKTRRHLPTVNAIWDNETSVLMGDYMVARAMLSVAKLNDIAVNQIVAETSCQLCNGEMQQVGSRGRFDLTEVEYYAIIIGKTAALFECGCRLGVLCALDNPNQTEINEIAPENLKKIENAALFGRNIGIAFQIADDLLDILGDETQMGKTLGSDLAKQKLTLPMIRLLNVLKTETRNALIAEIQNHLGQETYARIRMLLQEHHIYESVRETAINHITQAITLLDIFPDSPAKTAMIGFAKYAIERQQ